MLQAGFLVELGILSLEGPDKAVPGNGGDNTVTLFSGFAEEELMPGVDHVEGAEHQHGGH